MAEPGESRVAVYIDFDNIVISRYDQIHGRGAWRKDNVYRLPSGLTEATDEIRERLRSAEVDIGAILDFASSFGTIVLSRAYADWSVGVNASYQGQLMERAVDLTQLFPATQQMKNGADIRLSVDVVEDLFRLPDITHVVIAAGDSDYIALAQRAKRLGRYIVGIGVAGGTSKSLRAACNEYADYDALPGIRPAAHIAAGLRPAPAETSVKDATSTAPARAAESEGESVVTGANETPTTRKAANALLVRALRLVHEIDDTDWAHASALKLQMKRLDPAFNEKALGYASFSKFLKSRGNLVELDDSVQSHRVRLRT
ncbi:MAG: NYN domain-containing protein [Yonghaparkia sp.]|nr:NYN domain-containing protein [Microcella sp.]